MDHNPGRACYETDFSAQQPEAQTYPRFSCTHGDETRSPDTEPSAGEGSRAVDALADFGFRRRRRLQRPAEYHRVFAASDRSSDRFFNVLARHNEGVGPRLGLAVSKRVAKRAVARNRLKRLAREVFRQQRALPSLDFVVIAKPPAARALSQDLRASLQAHLKQLSRSSELASHG